MLSSKLVILACHTNYYIIDLDKKNFCVLLMKAESKVNSMCHLPGFNLQTFPFILVAEKKSIYILDVLRVETYPILTTCCANNAHFVKDIFEDFNFVAQTSFKNMVKINIS